MPFIHRGQTRESRRSKVERERVTKKRKRGFVALLLICILPILLIYNGIRGANIETQGRLLIPVKGLVFTGNKHLSDKELKTLSGITGEKEINLSPRSIRENLMKSPWIKDVCIRRDLPDILKIRIQEAEPLAILEMKGRPFLIDADGRFLEKLGGEAIPFLPVILSDPFKNKECYSEAINLARVLREKNIAKERDRVEIIATRDRESMSLVIDGVVIRVGYGNYDEKLDMLSKLEDEIRKRAIAVEYIDLRFSNKAIVKPVREVVK